MDSMIVEYNDETGFSLVDEHRQNIMGCLPRVFPDRNISLYGRYKKTLNVGSTLDITVTVLGCRPAILDSLRWALIQSCSVLQIETWDLTLQYGEAKPDTITIKHIPSC